MLEKYDGLLAAAESLPLVPPRPGGWRASLAGAALLWCSAGRGVAVLVL